MSTVKNHILPTIVIAQFCCTSLWFVGNSINSELIDTFRLNSSALGDLTTSVQFGFIMGTFLYAFLTITDLFSPSKVFFISAIVAAGFNSLIVLPSNTLASLITLRFFTGFFLAGIYPVGMKIASDYFKKGLGKSLGFLIGALVLGTAFPHFVKGYESLASWKFMIYMTSSLATFGGLIMLVLIPDGPYKKKQQQFNPSIFYDVFKGENFRKGAFGYFGHMWELYAFWAFLPVLLKAYVLNHNIENFNIAMISFIVIGFGCLGCVCSGYLSQIFTPKKVAATSLLLSGVCCLLSPLFFLIDSEFLFIVFLIFWGIVVIADSPLFSTIIAKNVLPEHRGTALTIVNCFGFAITIISIQLLNYLQNLVAIEYLFVLLAIGPVFGVFSLLKNNQRA
ncbi:MFS transporter [Seonamhaeicola sp. MEBiC1930]|uniref:MFS transporter n=1 Tax=Seonamhaeicola sp. MEBiC01930 TaxID=2976768 RepID=UPI003244992A